MLGTAPSSSDWKSNIILLYDIRIYYNTISAKESQASFGTHYFYFTCTSFDQLSTPFSCGKKPATFINSV